MSADLKNETTEALDADAEEAEKAKQLEKERVDKLMENMRKKNELLEKRYEEVEADKRQADMFSEIARRKLMSDDESDREETGEEKPSREEKPQHINRRPVNPKRQLYSAPSCGRRSTTDSYDDSNVNSGEFTSESSNKRNVRELVPPPDPKRGFLEDPERQNDEFDPPAEYVPQTQSRGRGRGRGRGSFNAHNFQRSSDDRPNTKKTKGRGRGLLSEDDIERSLRNQDFENNYTQWRQEREKIDAERLARQQTSNGGWRREWDVHKLAEGDDREPDQFGAGRREDFDRQDNRPQRGQRSFDNERRRYPDQRYNNDSQRQGFQQNRRGHDRKEFPANFNRRGTDRHSSVASEIQHVPNRHESGRHSMIPVSHSGDRTRTSDSPSKAPRSDQSVLVSNQRASEQRPQPPSVPGPENRPGSLDSCNDDEFACCGEDFSSANAQRRRESAAQNAIKNQSAAGSKESSVAAYKDAGEDHCLDDDDDDDAQWEDCDGDSPRRSEEKRFAGGPGPVDHTSNLNEHLVAHSANREPSALLHVQESHLEQGSDDHDVLSDTRSETGRSRNNTMDQIERDMINKMNENIQAAEAVLDPNEEDLDMLLNGELVPGRSTPTA